VSCLSALGSVVTMPGPTVYPPLMPSSSASTSSMHFKLGIDPKGRSLSQVSMLAELRASRAELDAYIKKVFQDLQPDETIQWLTTFRWRAIFTTNYDMGLERAFALNSKPLQNPLSISATSDLEYIVSVRQNHIDSYRLLAAHAVGVSSGSLWMDKLASPGRTAARYSRAGILSRRQVSTMERIAATRGPAFS